MASKVALCRMSLSLLISAAAACGSAPQITPAGAVPGPGTPISPTSVLTPAPPMSSRDPFDGNYTLTLDLGAEVNMQP